MKVKFSKSVEVQDANGVALHTIPAGEQVDWEPSHAQPYIEAGACAPVDEEDAAYYERHKADPNAVQRPSKFVLVDEAAHASDATA